jgi:hypothetical protein
MAPRARDIALKSPSLSTSFWTNQTKGPFPYFFFGGVVCLFSFFEVHHTKTLANQELGHTLWPSASLSQGDLLGKAVRPDASD